MLLYLARPFFLHQPLTFIIVTIVVDPIIKRLVKHRLKLESLSIYLSHVLVMNANVEILDKMIEFTIVWILFVRGNGDSVRKLLSKTRHSIVDQNYVLKTYVSENAQIFYIISVLGSHA